MLVLIVSFAKTLASLSKLALLADEDDHSENAMRALNQQLDYLSYFDGLSSFKVGSFFKRTL